VILSVLIDFIKEYYLKKYDYYIYQWQVILVLFVVVALLGVFCLGLDGTISWDNMIVALVLAIILWVAVLVINIAGTSLFGIFVTIFQSIFSALLVFLLLAFFMGPSDRKNDKETNV